MKLLNLAIVTTVLLFSIGCGVKNNYTLFQETQKQEEKASTKNNKNIVYKYKIAPNDRLSIIVFRHPELSTGKIDTYKNAKEGILVSKKGTIILPLIGEIRVQGLTKEEVRNLITEEYKKYLKHPEVYVEIVNQRVYVLGEVSKPGVVPIIDEKITLVEALAKAGDLNFYGKRNQILIIRGDLRNPDIIKVDLTKLENLKKTPIFLMPNDIVYVPPNKMREVNVVVNEIAPPLRLISDILRPFVQIKYLSQ